MSGCLTGKKCNNLKMDVEEKNGQNWKCKDGERFANRWRSRYITFWGMGTRFGRATKNTYLAVITTA